MTRIHEMSFDVGQSRRHQDDEGKNRRPGVDLINFPPGLG